jgi:hypothetical protein
MAINVKPMTKDGRGALAEAGKIANLRMASFRVYGVPPPGPAAADPGVGTSR